MRGTAVVGGARSYGTENFSLYFARCCACVSVLLCPQAVLVSGNSRYAVTGGETRLLFSLIGFTNTVSTRLPTDRDGTLQQRPKEERRGARDLEAKAS